ncbi:MAG: hypothetical protein B1H03_04670 [Planctomycetales bacterium 4484_113]|nr:MAG: hypothetical protein B1H03_04670 [Planctomycetales bacterium 4484_113]
MLALNPSHQQHEEWFRLRYCKDDELRFLGHRDTMRLLLKLLRQSRLPFQCTKGFSPRPRIVWGPPLPLGFVSRIEALDFALKPESDAMAAGLAERSLNRLHEAQGERQMILDVRHLRNEEPRISRAAVSARYTLVFLNEQLKPALTADQVEVWLTTEGRFVAGIGTNAEESSTSESQPEGGLLSWEVEDSLLHLHAAVGGRDALSLSRFVKGLAAHTALRFFIGERTALLDAQGEPVH